MLTLDEAQRFATQELSELETTLDTVIFSLGRGAQRVTDSFSPQASPGGSARRRITPPTSGKPTPTVCTGARDDEFFDVCAQPGERRRT